MKKKTHSKSKKIQRNKKTNYSIKKFLILLFFLSAFAILAYSFYLNQLITHQFETNRWSIPAKVYARSLEIYPSKRISANEIEKELYMAGYRRDKIASTQGSFSRTNNRFHIVFRDYFFPDGQYRKSMSINLVVEKGRIKYIQNRKSKKRLPLVRLEPAHIGTIFPFLKEDRILVSQQEVPKLLINSLVAVEDRQFFQHPGIDPMGILRAIWINLKVGEIRQGGSTLTQQLVKNYFLSREKSLQRKLKEALMSLLLEINYSKQEIITAYINEVFLAQNGRQAIHGFGLAAQYFFKRPLKQLSLPQIALLVGLVKGPSYYNPRRHPKRAKKRRNVVLKVLYNRQIINNTQYQKAIRAPLGISRNQMVTKSQYSAFMDLLKVHLKQKYDSRTLMTEGLKIYSTLSPLIQQRAYQGLEKSIKKISKPRKLQAAVVISQKNTGEILALIGSKNKQQTHFNRAIYAKRSIGSLIKPAIYLAALEEGYQPQTKIEDNPIRLKMPTGEIWQPKNFDRISHGQVTMIEALSRSYNQATVNLGMKIGIHNVEETLKKLGYSSSLEMYPADLLGAVAMAPIQIHQLYQSIADEGYYLPLKTIVAVVNKKNEVLQNLPINVEKRFNHDSMLNLDSMLYYVAKAGTAKGLKQHFNDISSIRGKTGTSNDNRDSWFIGYDDKYIATVWLGNDDNSKTQVTGASGALKVWAEIKKMNLKN